MWKPPIPINFVTLHYVYIITLGLFALIILYPYGNLKAVDAYFFGASASTESGLNTFDVKDLKTYQQLYIYFIPIISNLGFINIVVVVVRLHWFGKHLKRVAPSLLRAASQPNSPTYDRTEGSEGQAPLQGSNKRVKQQVVTGAKDSRFQGEYSGQNESRAAGNKGSDGHVHRQISFDPTANPPPEEGRALYIPPPQEREKGHPIIELDDDEASQDHSKPPNDEPGSAQLRRRPHRALSKATSIERVTAAASSVFVLGSAPQMGVSSSGEKKTTPANLPFLSSHATIGRNSQFRNLTARDREELGGVEYRSLRLLLKIVTVYFFGIHLLGAICLVGWIQNANPKYRRWLEECGQNKNWWAFYSAQTMVDNLGFTLTPDSMIQFQDATFPMLLMTFLAFAGNTFYPIFLRLTIWAMSKAVPRKSSTKESLDFLLEHPRRCYMLLFPSRPTWILCGILVALNFVDVLLIVVLDLDNPAVTNLPLGPRILAAIFQAASSRHTGTSTFNLAVVNPAVQFSLLVMMYISVYPIAISIRASNTYEERSLGIHYDEGELDEGNSRSYVLTHLKNQLGFDLWYVFLGIFCICIAESDKIMDPDNPAFAVFPIFFEVVSAYGNVGLSLGHPAVLTSLCGQFTTFSKIVICAMMIRGRHRGLPYELDRAVMLPSEQTIGDTSHVDGEDRIERASGVDYVSTRDAVTDNPSG